MSVVALDISKAFDSVDHTLLLKQISASGVNSNVVKWLAAYLRGRTASILYQSCKSPAIIIHSGVPQGSVLSPSLFNFFVSDFPLQLSFSHSFADNIYASRSSLDLSIFTSKLNEDMRQVEIWADSKNLSIAPEKSSITLSIPDLHQAKYHPQVFYKGQVIPLDRNPKWLGLIQEGYSFHVSDLKVRLSPRHQIVKALSDTSWGQSRETL
jgi:hypothetical protein